MLDPNSSHNKTIAKGAIVNILGAIGKGLFPVYLILITRLFGPYVSGLFYLIYVMMDTVLTMAVGGLNDGIVVFASRYADNKKDEKKLYQVLSNGLAFTLSICFILIFFAYFGGPELILKLYPQPMVLPAIQLLVWSLPFNAITILIISATKAKIIMKWDALILGFLRPLVLIIMSLICYYLKAGLDGLIWSLLLTSILLAITTLFVFQKYFSYRLLISYLGQFRFERELLIFSGPQSLNMTFNNLITNLDVLMLGYFKFSPELIGFYGMGAQIVRNLRQVKLAFSGALAPIVTRLHVQKDTVALKDAFSTVSRWTFTIALPIAALILIFRSDLIRIFHDTYVLDTTFMMLLLIPPLLSCAVGLAGNIIVMTGHSFWNLVNSLLIAGINALLNYLLIPRYGLIGAATATVVAATLVSSLQLIELYFLTKITLVIKKIYKPYVAAIPLVVILLVAGAFGEISFANKILTGIVCLAAYAFMIWSLKIPKGGIQAS